MENRRLSPGFTLIELSIVLVIIGLIVGGVLVGQDLISAAAVRAQVSQIEKFQTAMNTFRGKYGYHPGDIPNPDATRFGFASRGTCPGQGDGNGSVQADFGCAINGGVSFSGETGVFWVDMTSANGMNLNLIEGSFSTADIAGSAPGITVAAVPRYLPAAKIGSGNFVYIYTPGNCCPVYSADPTNYFGLSAVTGTDGGGGNNVSGPGLTVQQAYQTDKKVDDGLPQTGRVTATYVYAFGSSLSTNAISPSSTTCFDTTSGNYSVTQNNGTGVNCGLSFKFQ